MRELARVYPVAAVYVSCVLAAMAMVYLAWRETRGHPVVRSIAMISAIAIALASTMLAGHVLQAIARSAVYH